MLKNVDSSDAWVAERKNITKDLKYETLFHVNISEDDVNNNVIHKVNKNFVYKFKGEYQNIIKKHVRIGISLKLFFLL